MTIPNNTPSTGTTRHRSTNYRRDALWAAALIHRLSGVALALFLPLHFLALGLAIEGEARLEGFLRWTDNPMVKIAETGLIVLLAVHFLGGVRVLLIENMPWQEGQKSMAIAGIALALLVGLLFVFNIV